MYAVNPIRTILLPMNIFPKIVNEKNNMADICKKMIGKDGAL
jgi:hypothetical protein